MQTGAHWPCVIAGPASDVSSITTPASVADDMTTEIESPGRAVKPYTRAKLVGLCGAAQSRVARESRSSTSRVMGTRVHGCTTNSIATRAGLLSAFSPFTSSVSRYTPVGSPAGLNESRSLAGATPPLGLTESHCPPSLSPALQERVPCPALATATLSARPAVLPAAAESRICVGATCNVAMDGGVLVSLSTWQVATRNNGRARTTAPAARWPRARLPCNPLTFPKGPKLSPEWRRDDRCSNPHTGCLGRWGRGATGGSVADLLQPGARWRLEG